MSFRLRLLLLVVLVAVTATVATAWLTLRQASQQVLDSAAADQTQIDLVTDHLTRYGQEHGTWTGVVDLVRELRTRTGQRIHVVAESGVVLVDTDTEEGRSARPLGSSSTIVDPRPTLPVTLAGPDAAKATAKAITEYRHTARYAACLTAQGVSLDRSSGYLGLPQFAPAEQGLPELKETMVACKQVAAVPGDDVEASRQVQSCLTASPVTIDGRTPPGQPAPSTPATREDELRCLAGAFTEGIRDVTPVPVRIYFGARGEAARPVATGPLLAAAAGIALVVILGTALVSHRVLRPIRTLTTVAQHLGRGDLSSRVPVHGNDELAHLGRSFNRMADSLQRGEERQRRLVADVAHELRTPLANLRGYLEALADGVIAPDPELFASLHEEAVLQQRIVDDLQDLALAEAGRLAYHRVAVDVAELLETCRTAHRARAEAAGVTLTVQVEPQPAVSGGGAAPPLVSVDPDRLRQVLGNLITNAVRATAPGGSISLHATGTAAAAVIRVADTGTGIEPSALPHIFDRFWRADPARGRQTGGGGLGLAIARQIVTDHGGTITVASQVDVGTTFTITLPALVR
ncbi:ATP-binding protein [Micromonospora sp. DR5-3]|uniref:sensor histidine kinase n=1 Tax=unclassified Micromonospora TaxID=2617518 RepID=UPI0011D98F0B|nr:MULTISPECIES: ATP-binding protein [unclassified Micromonospora]MCW3816189.1 ATP-binding protein [Micromonospora sp. DR5-3]TYC19163.1 HAMP domain-containing protein [Micromonospora sp. MP36]